MLVEQRLYNTLAAVSLQREFLLELIHQMYGGTTWSTMQNFNIDYTLSHKTC